MARMMTALQLAEAEAEDPESDSARVWKLASHKSARVRHAVASNRAAENRTLRRLLDDQVPEVRMEAAITGRSRRELHSALVRHDDRSVRALFVWVLESDPHCIAYADQQLLAGDSFRDVRSALAGHTPYAGVFDRLLHDDDARVRGWCASNPRISLEQMERLVTDRAWNTRSLSVVTGLRYPTDEQLVRLARDRSAEVRWAVLIRVDAPREALEIIAQDSDDMNRRHAELVLNGDGVNPPGVIMQERRRRAEIVHTDFEPAP
jgi:hypothetical protein